MIVVQEPRKRLTDSACKFIAEEGQTDQIFSPTCVLEYFEPSTQDLRPYSTPTPLDTVLPNTKTSVRSGEALSSPLLRLPTEIRNSVYELVMISETPIERKRGTYALFTGRTTAIGKKTRAWYEQRQHVDAATSLSLALTCRLIYRETTGYYYILNKFTVNLLDFPDISHSIRSTNFNRITMVHCTVPAECPLSSMVYLFAMAGLKQLQLKLERSVPRGVDEFRGIVEKMCQ